MQWSLKSEVWFLTANRACCWIFCSLFLVLSLSPRQPWSLNKVFIHHMCPCINKHNKKTKKETQIWQLWEQIPLSSTGVFCSFRVFFLKQLHINQNWLKYNLYPVLETLMKHCLLVSSCHFFSPFFFLSFLFCYLSTVKFQFRDESFLTTSQLKQCGIVMTIFTITYKSI